MRLESRKQSKITQVLESTLTLSNSKTSAVPVVCEINRYNPQGSCCEEQFSIPFSYINAPPGPRNAPLWFKSIAKKPSVKVDLAIYCLQCLVFLNSA